MKMINLEIATDKWNLKFKSSMELYKDFRW